MSSIYDILNTLSKTESNNKKLEILESHKSNTLLQDVFRLAYSRNIQFGIKKIPEYQKPIAIDRINLETALSFIENDLATRKFTGNEAISELTKVFQALHKDDAQVLARVIKRDLECGCSEGTANKVWPSLIGEQPKMLATSRSDKALAKIKYPAYAQLKADGARCFAEIYNNEGEPYVKLLSRAGNEYTGLDHIKNELITLTAELRSFSGKSGGIVIDGELLFTNKNSVNDSIDSVEDMFSDKPETTESEVVVLRSESNGIANKSLKGTISQDESKAMIFNVWDTYTLESAYNSDESSTYKNRFELVNKMFGKSDIIIPIENNLVFSLDEAKEVYQKYIEKGLEGIILKNIDSLWENKRSANQVKFKEIIDIDLEIVDVYPHKKDPNKLGGFSVKSKCGKITVNVGSGLTDTTKVRDKKTKVWIDIPLSERSPLDRELLWSDRENLIGKVLEVECNGWLTSKGRKDGTVGLFLPIVKRIRLDKESGNTFKEVFEIDCPV